MLSGSFYLAVIPNCRSELIYYIISSFVCQVLFSKFFELFFEALFKPKPFDIFPSPVPFRDSLPIISHPVPFVNPFSEVSFRTLCDLPVFGLPRGTACLYYHTFPLLSTVFDIFLFNFSFCPVFYKNQVNFYRKQPQISSAVVLLHYFIQKRIGGHPQNPGAPHNI